MSIKEGEEGEEISVVPVNFILKIIFKNLNFIKFKKLDLRIFVKTDSYAGATKRGVRFYLFDDDWPEFKKLIDKVDKIYEEIA